jgi:uridine phosphorylase
MTMTRLTTIALLILTVGCTDRRATPADRSPSLDAYDRFNDSPRVIDPKGYIDFLKSTRFTHGELDSLPVCAIVLHDARPLMYLARAHIDTMRVERLVLGSSDPTEIRVVSHPPPGEAPFIITAGLPGAGGIATQTSELGALGVRAIVHVGTAGLLGDAVPDSAAVLAAGSYKDGGAVMLSNSRAAAREPIARPDSLLSAAVGNALAHAQVPYLRQTGFTVPIIYYQPSGLIQWLLEGPDVAAERPAYVEMEEASLFETGQLTHVRMASVVVGSDRYRMEAGKPAHSFTNLAADSAKQRVIGAVIGAFSQFAECRR